ncbi:hypothetical protein [Reyranella soli]|uniref:Uncharacterized protein n=1 Tax=Reyranella soli TaxID=1230389 RepID=A0A512NNM2_9HYPH|nr:hypothetical protein [Reyranella soli]GEP60551.1 hypothetical protein RSO01_77170 [Reyranella soli]
MLAVAVMRCGSSSSVQEFSTGIAPMDSYFHLEIKRRSAITNVSLSGARWHAVVTYRTNAEPYVVEMSLKEIGDLHMKIERGHLDTVELIEIRRVNHVDSPTLTLAQASRH